MHYSRYSKLTLNQAAKYFGCRPQILQRLRRLGWLKAAEDGAGWSNLPAKKCHFYHTELDKLAWDYFYSLSMYDIVAIRMNYEASPKVISAWRGIPLMVVNLVVQSETAAYITHLVQLYGRFRGSDLVCEELDNPPSLKADLSALARQIKQVVDSNCKGYRLDASTRAEIRSWRAVALPLSVFSLPERQVFGMNSLTDPFAVRLQDAAAWNLNRHLPEHERLPESEQLRRRLQTEPQYQTPPEPKAPKIRKPERVARSLPGKLPGLPAEISALPAAEEACVGRETNHTSAE